MNDIEIAICEDDKAQIEYMRSLINDWADKNRVDCHVDAYISAEQFLFSFDKDFPYHLYILDIQMGGINGMELAKKIRQKDAHAVLVFLTGLRDYALEGYEVEAFRYLIKPVKEEEFYEIMTQIAKNLEQKEHAYFILDRGGELIKIPYTDIWYIESQGHYVELSYSGGKLQWKASIGSLQGEFEENGFVMTRRGVLVNINCIDRVTKTECILDNGESISISRSRYSQVNEAFIEYYKNRRG